MPILPESNLNHCIPKSFSGSSESVNLSRVDRVEHDVYHEVNGHSPPDWLLRRMLIASVGWESPEGKKLPAGLYEDLLPDLLHDDWHTPYNPQAFEPVPQTAQQEEHYAKVAFHLGWYLDQERALTMDGAGFLGIHKRMPKETAAQLDATLGFFKKRKPHRAMQHLLTDANSSMELKWVKPMLEHFRRKLLCALQNVRPEVLNGSRSNRIFDVLLDHHAKLTECAKIYEPNIAVYARILKRMANGRNGRDERSRT